VLLITAGMIAGCGGSGPSTTTSSTASVSLADLSRAADVSAAASGYRTVMTMHQTVPGLGQLTLTGTGSFDKQQQGSMNMTIKIPGAAAAALGSALQVAMVIDHGTVYMKLPTSLTSRLPGIKPWLQLNLNQAGAGSNSGISSLLSSSRQLSDPSQYFQWLHAVAGSSLKNLGTATVDGVHTTHYHAEVGLSQLSQAFRSGNQPALAQAEAQLRKTIAGGKVPIDVYIDSSNLVRRIVINEAAKVDGKTESSAITLDFPQYGSQPAPTVPPSNQITNFRALSGIF
jgi:hypothetical protein